MYKNFIKFLPNDKISGDFPLFVRFLQNFIFIHKNELVIHHSHVTRKIIGYAHNYCNLQIRENCYTIPVFAHNQFRFDFFLFLKGLRAGVWETTEVFIGGKNPTDKNFAIVQNQVRFIDTVKYYQQSLASLAASMTDIEKENVREGCRKFFAEKLMFLNNEQEKWVLDYLDSGKGMIPYQMITDFSSLEIKPKDDFFKKKDFYSSLKEKDISTEEYENVKKFFKLLRLKTLGDMNRIYNFQDTLILCEIFEQRASEFNDSESSSVKTIAAKSNASIKCTTRFMSGKLLMFELSLISFIYSLVELLAFPEENPIVQQIYEKYHIEKIYCYHVLTDTDSKSETGLINRTNSGRNSMCTHLKIKKS